MRSLGEPQLNVLHKGGDPSVSAVVDALPRPPLQEIGHDCTTWTPAVYFDLMRLGDGTGAPCSAAFAAVLVSTARMLGRCNAHVGTPD